MRRRPDLGVPAAEVDERRPFLGRGGGDAPEQRDEVLLRQPLQALLGAGASGDRIRRHDGTRLAA